MESHFLKDGHLSRVRIGQPFSGREGPFTLDAQFRTTPGHQSGAQWSQETAIDLAARIVLTLAARGALTSRPCETCGSNQDTSPFLDPETDKLSWFCAQDEPEGQSEAANAAGGS